MLPITTTVCGFPTSEPSSTLPSPGPGDTGPLPISLLDHCTLNTPQDVARYNLIGCNDSSLESLTLEDVTNIPSISTVSSLQDAGSSFCNHLEYEWRANSDLLF